MLRRVLRTAGFPLITCPSVALAHLTLSGSLPPASSMIVVALIAVLAGLIAERAARTQQPSSLVAPLAGAQILGHLSIFILLGEPARGCLPAMGRGAELGLRLAVLRESSDCAPGQYAIGTVPATALTVIVLAVAVLLWQFLVAAAGMAVLRMAERTWTAATTLAAVASSAATTMSLRALVLALRGITARSLTPPARPWPISEPRPLLSAFVLRAVPRRGPPAAAAV